ncbi:MAG: hypothetical protein RBG13Loki_4172, partial [Promethearchaeota archaeon CR_4]
MKYRKITNLPKGKKLGGSTNDAESASLGIARFFSSRLDFKTAP